MPAHTLPGIGLSGGYSPGDDGWSAAMNLNLLLLSALGKGALSRVTALPGSPTDGQIYIVPSPDNRLAIRDAGAWTYFTPVEGVTLWVADEDALVTWTGSTWKTSGSAPVFVGTFADTAPTSSQVLLDWVFGEDVTFADDFAGSRASVGTNPAGSFAIAVQKNGSSVGTITISTAGTATFATTGSTVSFVAGDLLTLVAPSTPDASIARLRVTMKATR